MRKSMVEKLHDKLVKIVDTGCYGKNYYSIRVSKVSDTEFDMKVVAEDMVEAALFNSQKPEKYSKSRIFYSNEKSRVVTYEGKPNCWEVTAHMTVR